MKINPGSFIKEELNKQKGELNTLREEKEKYSSELHDLKASIEQNTSGNSLTIEELEWDLHLTERGIEEKLRSIAKLQEEGALSGILKRTEIELGFNKTNLAKAGSERSKLAKLRTTGCPKSRERDSNHTEEIFKSQQDKTVSLDHKIRQNQSNLNFYKEEEKNLRARCD